MKTQDVKNVVGIYIDSSEVQNTTLVKLDMYELDSRLKSQNIKKILFTRLRGQHDAAAANLN